MKNRVSHKERRPRRFPQEGKDPGEYTDSRKAQIIWTLCVGTTVLVAAIYQLSGSGSLFALHTTPEAVRTGAPVTQDGSRALPALPWMDTGINRVPSSH